MSESAQPKEKKKRLLSREQQAIWRRDQRKAMRGKPPEERRAMRLKMKSQLESMSESDRAKLTKDLQGKWDALSSSEKQAIERAMKERKRGKRKGRKGAAGAGGDDDE